MYFFETLVRIHRAGEGVPYTGLKPAGRDLGPAIPMADKALETGAVEPLVKLLTDKVQDSLHEYFTHAIAKKKFNKLEHNELHEELVKATKEYQGRNHIVAREHYRGVFCELIPKYFTTRDEVVGPSSEYSAGYKRALISWLRAPITAT